MVIALDRRESTLRFLFFKDIYLLVEVCFMLQLRGLIFKEVGCISMVDREELNGG